MATDLLSAETATTVSTAAPAGETLSQQGSGAIDPPTTESRVSTVVVSKSGEGQGGFTSTVEESQLVKSRSAASLLLSDFLQLTKPRIVVMILVLS